MKQEQAERLGMGFGGASSGSKADVFAHSSTSTMRVIEQQDASKAPT